GGLRRERKWRPSSHRGGPPALGRRRPGCRRLFSVHRMAVAQVNRILYLHGFASSPGSKKARYFQEHFAERGVAMEILDLAQGDFDHLTISGQLDVIEHVANEEP